MNDLDRGALTSLWRNLDALDDVLESRTVAALDLAALLDLRDAIEKRMTNDKS